MTIWTLFQMVLNLILFVGFAAMWMRLRRPPQDDPRLSRGLQLLQTKITVLEDLSDRTDSQVKQLTGILDQKTRIVQNKILEAEQQVLKIDHSMSKSLEVAEIFQDKIPHQEILERQRTVEYVKAARMAHSGLSVDEIAEAVHLPREQIELIAKFNRDQLMFDENQLPEWATRQGVDGDPSFALNDMDFVGGLETRRPDLAQVKSNFQQAVDDARHKQDNPPPGLMDSRVAESLRHSMASGMESMQPAVHSIKTTAQNLKDRLVSTAEDLLRTPLQPSPVSPAPPLVRKVGGESPPDTHTFTLGRPQSPILRGDSLVKKVIFPRIEK